MFEVTVKNASNRLVATKDVEGNVVAGVRQDIESAKDMLDGITLDPNTDEILWTLIGADAWVTFDGTTPSSSNGHLVPEGASLSWCKELCAEAKWQGTGAALQLNEVTAKESV